MSNIYSEQLFLPAKAAQYSQSVLLNAVIPRQSIFIPTRMQLLSFTYAAFPQILFAATCYLCVLCCCVYFGQLFMTLTPPHWCRAPPELEGLNLTQEELKNLTIPRHPNGKEFLACQRYDVNFTEVLKSDTPWPGPSWPLTPCTHGWTYNYSFYYPTITSQLDWVCDEDWRPALAQSLFFVGSMVGTPTLGWAADAWGRLPLIVFTNVLGGVAGVVSAFSNSFAMFAALRFLVGFTFEQMLMIGYMLTQEYVSSEYRTVMANAPVMVFLTGSMCGLPWLAWWLADWSTFVLVIHAPQFLTIVFLWSVVPRLFQAGASLASRWILATPPRALMRTHTFSYKLKTKFYKYNLMKALPESARWLLSRGRVDRTVAILKTVARVNRKPLTPAVIQGFKDFGEKQRKASHQKVTVLDLFKTPILRKRYIVLIIMWCTLFVAYDGHTRNTENIGHNVFVSFTIAGLVELPADFATMLATEWLGRRHTTVGSLVLSGLAGLCIAFIPEDDTIAIMVMAFIGRFLVTMSMDIGHQYPVEVLPTVARGQGIGAMQTVGFLCGFSSPYIAYLSKFGPSVPYVVLGAITVTGGFVCLLLPETLNEKLPDTLEEGELFFANQGLFHNPCGRRNKISAGDAGRGTTATPSGSKEKNESNVK
ncbi:organic cation transporter protein-like [Penaeus indicus]|uniref:organic cation transporter protein-like n=1 Tax=Penaeus indicus TaxID=29960 RepID=UPI00300D8F72